jgi:hypothetical protein
LTRREEARDALAFAEFAMAAQYDNKHHPLDITEGDSVFINFDKKDRDGYKAVGIVSPSWALSGQGLIGSLKWSGKMLAGLTSPATGGCGR